ncbi:MAG TPA: hypothetical protein VKA65_03890, partial [Acidimicrobiales bacterium]|nr:hypothetical protein [Acidimicrobiales bacterium]
MPGRPLRVARRRLAPAATILVLASALPGVDPLSAIRAEQSRADRARDGEEVADKDLLRWVGAVGESALGDEAYDSYDPYATIDEPWPTSAGGTGLAAGEAGPDGEVDAGGLPEVALKAYLRAERALGLSDPDCGLEWPLLAAIGRVESDHGRYGGSILDEDGNGSRPIRGIALDGRDGVARIADTDGGALDGDRTYDRAVGPMQFIPGTWERVSVDANADGARDPDNIYDAALAAAVYLCAGGADLTTEEGREAAVLRYNHSEEYVRTVLRLADAYARGETGTLPDPGPLPGDVPSIDSPLLPPANVDSPPYPPAPVVIPRPPAPPAPARSGADSGSGGEVAGAPASGGTTTTTRPGATTTTTRPGATTTTTTRPAPTGTTTTTRPGTPLPATPVNPPTTAPPTTAPPTTAPPTT